MHRNTAINLAVWSGLVLVVAVLALIIEFRTLTLCVNYQTTTGTISEKFPNNHLGIGFGYKVLGQQHTGTSYAGEIGRSFDAIQLGDAVTVFYDEHHPANYTLETPKVLLVRTIGQIIAACVILPVIGTYLYAFAKKAAA
jgi:hypothetical protein